MKESTVEWPGDLVVRINEGRVEIVQADPWILISTQLLEKADERYMHHNPEAGKVVFHDDFGASLTYVLGDKVDMGRYGIGYREARLA